MTDHEATAQMATTAAAGAKDRPGHRAIVAWGTVCAAAILGLGLTFVLYAAHQERQIGALSSQVRQLGGVPLVSPQPGPAGAVGERGPKGDRGDVGSSGAPGATGVAGPSGAPGADGRDGRDGASGQPAATASPGPSGAAGPTGPAGPAGPTGPSGPKGDKGTPCPAGYEQRPARITASDGSTYDGVACVQPGSRRTTTTAPVPPLPGS